MSTAPKIYLGTPAIFHANAVDIIHEMKRLCSIVGLEGVAPVGGSDLGLIKQTDGGIFCLDTFRRGTEMEQNTAITLGYMAALDKPMAGWTRDERNYSQRVEDFYTTRSLPLSFLKATVQRDPDGFLIHGSGPHQDSAAHQTIKASGGTVHVHENWKQAFADAAHGLSTTFGMKHEPIQPQAIVAGPALS